MNTKHFTILSSLLAAVLVLCSQSVWSAANGNSQPALVNDVYDYGEQSISEHAMMMETLAAIQTELSYIRNRVSPTPSGISICTAASLSADGSFSSGGSVGVDTSTGIGLEFLGNGFQANNGGDLAASQEAGISASNGLDVSVCLDVIELADQINERIASEGYVPTERDEFVLALATDSDNTKNQLIDFARDRLGVDEMLVDDSNNPINQLAEQVDSLEYSLSDATLLVSRIEMVADAAWATPMPANLTNRLDQPWGVIPDVTQIDDTCAEIDSVIGLSVCANIKEQGGYSVTYVVDLIVDNFEEIKGFFTDMGVEITNVFDSISGLSSSLFGDSGGGGGDDCTVFSEAWWAGDC